MYGPNGAFDTYPYDYLQVYSVILLQIGPVSGADVNVYRDIV